MTGVDACRKPPDFTRGINHSALSNSTIKQFSSSVRRPRGAKLLTHIIFKSTDFAGCHARVVSYHVCRIHSPNTVVVEGSAHCRRPVVSLVSLSGWIGKRSTVVHVLRICRDNIMIVDCTTRVVGYCDGGSWCKPMCREV